MPLAIPQPLADHPELAVEVTTGIEGWRTGRIVLTVRGDGGVTVRNRRSGEEERAFEGTLDRAEVDALGVELDGLELPGRAGATEPDDSPVVVALRDGEAGESAEAWNSRRYDDARLDAALRRAEAIVSAVTGGQLPFGEAA